jgi:hypothetical protein
MLRALALKAAQRGGRLLTSVKVALSHGTRVARAASSTALAVIGSGAGYQLVRHTTRTTIETLAKVLAAGASLLRRGLWFLGRTARAGIGLLSPTAAFAVDDVVQRWIIRPAATAVTLASTWVRDAATAVWDLSDQPLVKTITTRAAQIAGLILAAHSLTQGAAATKLVQALPWLMDTVLTFTNPTKALALVLGAFVTGLLLTATRLLDTRPEPHDPKHATEQLLDPGTPPLVAAPRTAAQPSYDLDRIAAQVNVEVTPDGSVLVHGIPTELPDDIAHQLARLAADAATARLEKVLLHRPIPNRGDRRVITKTAREALRTRGRLIAA